MDRFPRKSANCGNQWLVFAGNPSCIRRGSLARTIRRQGYRVLTYSEPELALEELPLLKPDLLILDVLMPELSGFEVLDEVRRYYRGTLPVVLNAANEVAVEAFLDGRLAFTAISRLIGVGLSLQGAVRRRDDVKTAMQECMTGIMPQLEKRTHYLATAANVATLLGLLGTVSGLIHSFAAVATVNPAEKANLLSASISEAMNCTAFGLMTAVPILVVHAFLQSKTQGLSDGLETAAIRFLNALAARQAARAESRLELVQKSASAA